MFNNLFLNNNKMELYPLNYNTWNIYNWLSNFRSEKEWYLHHQIIKLGAYSGH